MPALLVPLLLSAAIELDPQTGLWFPPYASKTAYLNRDPGHPYMQDVERAFQENASLAAEVCRAFLAAKEPAVFDPSVKQFRAMFAMKCIGRSANADRRATAATQTARAMVALQAIFDQEEQSVASLSTAERAQRHGALLNQLDSGVINPLRPAFRAIALDPRHTFPLHDLMAYPDVSREGDQTFSRESVAAFLEQLYRTRSVANRADAQEWQAGLPAVLLFEGKLSDAHSAADVWLNAAPRERRAFARSMVAVIDRASGQADRLRIAAPCEAPPSWRASNPEMDPAEYCKSATQFLVINSLDVLRHRAPAALVAAAFDLIQAEPDNYPARMTLLRATIPAGPGRAEEGFYEVLGERDAPSGAKLDALRGLWSLASENHPEDAAPLIDCWLKMLDVYIPPLASDGWSRLAAMPESQTAFAQECFGAGNLPSHCVVNALQVRAFASQRAKQWNVARLSVEKLLSLMLLKHGSPSPVRDELYNLAAEVARNGAPADAAAIIGYLSRQPHDGYVTAQLASWKGEVTAGATQPWKSPIVVDPARVQGECPPSRPTRKR